MKVLKEGLALTDQSHDQAGAIAPVKFLWHD